jgi:3-oxoacyl-[acyl-carrier protein] reductase
VTGVSRRQGIGFAIASRFAELGADLFLHAHAPEFDPVRELPRSRRVERLEADFRDPQAPARVVAAARQALGHLDIFVANHAYSTQGELEQVTADDIDRHLEINVRATLLLVQAFAAQHDGRPGGRVVLLTSGQQRGPMAGELAYAASKGALHPLVLSLSRHLAPRGITVNAVNPGPTDTGWATPELHAKVLKREPQGRWGEPADAARLIGWLASDQARWITGQSIDSTGGFQ